MQTPVNLFKQALAEGRPQIGLWMGLANAYAAEICAGAGFDWLLIDGEHAPNGLTDVLAQLQAVAAYPGVNPIARVPFGHGEAGAALIKQYLDLGVPTLLVPMVDTPEQAAALVRATRYPQDDDQDDPQRGIRGMAGGRASRWGRYAGYGKEANEQVCLLIQAETGLAMRNLDALAATPGVHGIFIGPADLSASMGHVGNPGHPDVQRAIEDGIARIRKAGGNARLYAPQTEWDWVGEREALAQWLAALPRPIGIF
ncbi:MAG TPA: HpcH/HpaI aldolase/citrate lyase family protein, partial [Ottowia sp.]|nr:HpcH/HpaI aldolase/citrate lyase family protein [Ottowia sp.]